MELNQVNKLRLISGVFLSTAIWHGIAAYNTNNSMVAAEAKAEVLAEQGNRQLAAEWQDFANSKEFVLGREVISTSLGIIAGGAMLMAAGAARRGE